MFCSNCEKFGEGLAEGNGDDHFGGGQSWPNGADPGAKGLPHQLGFGGRKDLQQALGDEAELDVAMISRDLAADVVTVFL